MKIRTFLFFSIEIFLNYFDFTNAEPVSVFTFHVIYDECLKGSQLCLGYVDGVGETMSMSYSGNSKWSICDNGKIPPASAMVQAVLNFGQQHPEFWEAPSLPTVAVALQNTWPCRK